MNRTHFLASTIAAGTIVGTKSATAQSIDTLPQPSASPAPPKRFNQFFNDGSMNFIFLLVLGSAYYGIGDVGTTLSMMDRVEDGNAGSAFAALTMYGKRARSAAAAALAAGHRASARELYLQASNYTFAATYFCDEMSDPDSMQPTWQASRTDLNDAFALFDNPVEHINIPYAGTTLPGYFIKADRSDIKRPLLIMTNGSDGSILDLWVQGGKAAIERGYNILIYDGPGQGAALWLQHVFFRPDWETVITPVVDFAVRRGDVDPHRIAQQGISQGGYFAPRSMAFERRIAACIADGGVVDVSRAWYASITPQGAALLASGQKAIFDRAILSLPPKPLAGYTFRARPFGMSSPFDTFTEVKNYTLAGLFEKIVAPILIANPENEQFFPGQSLELYNALGGAHNVLVPFAAADGADYHCEPATPGLRSQRAFDWLDTTLSLGR